MPYLDIVFHNTQHGNNSINQAGSRAYYTTGFIAAANAFQSNVGSGNTPANVPPSAGWGNCVAGANNASGIFLCESPPYDDNDYNHWQGNALAVPPVPSAIPAFPTDHTNSGFTPFGVVNTLCAFLEGEPEAAPAVGAPVIPAPALNPTSVHWIGTQGIRCLGTGATVMRNGQAPWGSDRYGIKFQAHRRSYPNGNNITGIFIHIKNTHADPGTQIAALCREYPTEIIFGDLNLNLRQPLNLESLGHAIGATHTILALQNPTGGNQYYITHQTVGLAAGTCLDYALIPNAHVADVELWAHRPGAAATLSSNNSDHSVMMLRIRCN